MTQGTPHGAQSATPAIQPEQPAPISYADVEAAAARLRGQAHHTPVVTSHSFDARAGIATAFKCEQFQRGGAFKFRGAYNKLATLPPAERARGVIAFSSGNHAQAVALVARIFGVPAVICMPTDAPEVKVAGTRDYGAEIVFYDRISDDREALARRLAEERGLTLVPPYNDPAIMAGAGTVARELLGDVPYLDVIAAPVGGGGLIAGTSVAARALRPGITVIGVETEAANHAYLSLKEDQRTRIAPPDTIADGIRTAQLGTLAWPVVRANVAAVVLVSEDEVREAMRFLLQRLKLVVEPTGAVAAAAALTGKLAPYGGRAGIILSGGNVAPDVLCEVLAKG